jgi:hypothetical protein
VSRDFYGRRLFKWITSGLPVIRAQSRESTRTRCLRFRTFHATRANCTRGESWASSIFHTQRFHRNIRAATPKYRLITLFQSVAATIVHHLFQQAPHRFYPIHQIVWFRELFPRWRLRIKLFIFDMRQMTIGCARSCPAEVANVQRRAKAGRNQKLRAPRFRKINPRKRRKHHGIKTEA